MIKQVLKVSEVEELCPNGYVVISNQSRDNLDVECSSSGVSGSRTRRMMPDEILTLRPDLANG